MALEIVTVYVKDQQAPAQPVDGVTVQVYDSTGAVFITSGITGTAVTGEAEFLLDGDVLGTVYKLRFYKAGVTFTGAASIAVTSPANPTNKFDMSAQTHILPVSPDANMCRCSGYFKDPSGQPLAGLTFIFNSILSQPTPQVVGSGATAHAVLHKRQVQTDSFGYMVVDLYRNSEVEVTMSTQENVLGTCVIPDLPSSNIVHILYPVVGDVTYDPASPVSVAAGGSEVIDVVFTYTSGVTRFCEGLPLTISTSDPNIATASFSGNYTDGIVLTVLGVSAGTCTLTPVVHYSVVQPIITLPIPPALPSMVINVA